MAATRGTPRVYVGVSERGQATGTGGVYSSSNPQLGRDATWTAESSGAFNSDVGALAVGRDASSNRVILAGVSNTAGTTVGGLWRKVGSTWTQFRNASTVPFGRGDTSAANNMGCIRFRRNSAVAYALDDDGLWRTNDAGANWTKILSGVSATYGTYDGLVLDPTNTAIVYVSSGGTVRRVNNASTSTGTGNTNTTTIWSGSGGNIAIKPDGSFMLINVRDGRLMKSTSFRTASNQSNAGWTNIANSLFQNHSGNIRSLTITKDGIIMTADNGSGAFRGVPV